VSVARCLEINARLRAAGVTVHEWSGWQSRGNGQASAYVGGLIHHTASAFGPAPSVLVNGRTDLAGPLCNYAGNDDGSVTVIAAHPANHAGASGGRSMGPLPVTNVFNKYVMGLEVVYPGTVAMRPAQYRTAAVWARVVADVVGAGNIQCIRAHAETSITGKWDPGYAPGKTIDMSAFRADATRGVSDSMDPNNPYDGALMFRMLAFLQGAEQRTQGGGQVPEALPMVTNLKALMGRVEAIINHQETVTYGPRAGVEKNRLYTELQAAKAAQTAALAKVETLAAKVDTLTSKMQTLTFAGVDVTSLAAELGPAVASAVNDEFARRQAE